MDRQILKSALGSSPECLPVEQLEALTRSDAQIPPHVAQCPRCQAELQMLKCFESGDPLPDEGAAVAWISSRIARRMDEIKHPVRGRQSAPRDEVQSSWMRWLWSPRKIAIAIPALAALAIAVVGIALLRTPKEPDLRADAGSHDTIYRSGEVQLVGPVGDLEQIPTTLQWKAFPSATKYKVTLMEIDRVPIWEIKNNDTSLTIPSAVKGKMLPGKPFLWQVSALDVSGRVLATSQVQKFVVPRGASFPGASLPRR